MTNGTGQYATVVAADQRYHVKVAYGLARAYRIALETLESLDRKKQQVWSLIRREIENARESDTISLTDMRDAVEVGSNASEEWWECGINEIRARDHIESTYLGAAERADSGSQTEEVSGIDPDDLVSASSDSAGDRWFETTDSRFVEFGRKFIKAKMAVELFAEQLKNWLFFDGKSYHGYVLHFYRQVGEQLAQGMQKIPHPCGFIQVFMEEPFEEQVTILERITRDLHKSSVGTEILRAFVDENRSIWPGANRASRITTGGGTALGDLNEFGANDPRTHEDWGEPSQRLFGQGPTFNGGLNLLCLFDEARRSSQFAHYKSASGRNTNVISNPSDDGETFVEHQGSDGEKLVLSGGGKSAALSVIAQRLMVGTSRVIGVESRELSGDPEGKAAKVVGVTVDVMFTDGFITELLNIDPDNLRHLKEGETGSLTKPGDRGIEYTQLSSSEKWTHGEQLFKQGQLTWGYFASAAEGFTQFNEFLGRMQEYGEEAGESLGGTDDMNVFQRKAIAMSTETGTDGDLGARLTNQPWVEEYNRFATGLGAFMAAVSSLSLVGEIVVLGDKKDWSFSDAFAMVGQLSELYSTLDDIAAETGGELSGSAARIITTTTTDAIGIVGDVVEVGVTVGEMESQMDAGDLDAAIASGLEAGLAAGGAVATAVSIFSGGTAAPIGGMVAAASAVGGMTVAFVSWVLGVEEPEIVNWVKNTYFGSNWGSADYTDLNSKWYRFRIEDSGYADGETTSRVAFGRQISGYLNHKVPFEDRTVEIETFARPYKGVIELRNITKGTFGSDLIVCPIAADSGRPAYPLHVIHLGEPSQTSHGVEITGKTNDQALDMGEEPSWVDDPPGEVWAWTGTMEATGNANYEDFFAAPGEEDPAYYRLRADDYANTAGVELIHVPGGLNNTLREKIETASTAQQATTDAKDVLAIIDELPYPRQRVPRSQLSLPEG